MKVFYAIGTYPNFVVNGMIFCNQCRDEITSGSTEFCEFCDIFNGESSSIYTHKHRDEVLSKAMAGKPVMPFFATKLGAYEDGFDQKMVVKRAVEKLSTLVKIDSIVTCEVVGDIIVFKQPLCRGDDWFEEIHLDPSSSVTFLLSLIGLFSVDEELRSFKRVDAKKLEAMAVCNPALAARLIVPDGCELFVVQCLWDIGPFEMVAQLPLTDKIIRGASTFTPIVYGAIFVFTRT